MFLVVDLDLEPALSLGHISHVPDKQGRYTRSQKTIYSEDRLLDVHEDVEPSNGPDESEILKNIHYYLAVLLGPELLSSDLYLEDLHRVHP